MHATDVQRRHAEDEFADSHHLLRSGAARFSRQLVGHIGPWVRAGGR